MSQVATQLELAPDATFDTQIGDVADSIPKTLLIGCGALAREILAIIKINKLDHIDLTCLPASWHNTPEKITPGILAKLDAYQDIYDKIYVLYGDCGTGGQLDAVLNSRGVERIPGPHCYSFFAGEANFDALMEEELGTFFLTDYLVQHFQRLVIDGMGISKHPDLRDMLFGNYKRLVYIAQAPTDALQTKAKAAADQLGLDYEFRASSYGELASFMTDKL